MQNEIVYSYSGHWVCMTTIKMWLEEASVSGQSSSPTISYLCRLLWWEPKSENLNIIEWFPLQVLLSDSMSCKWVQNYKTNLQCMSSKVHRWAKNATRLSCLDWRRPLRLKLPEPIPILVAHFAHLLYFCSHVDTIMSIYSIYLC